VRATLVKRLGGDNGPFLSYYRDANRLVGVVIMEATSLPQARINITMRSVAVGAPFAEWHELSVRQRALVPASRQLREIAFRNNLNRAGHQSAT
jgi:hypothetical protein